MAFIKAMEEYHEEDLDREIIEPPLKFLRMDEEYDDELASEIPPTFDMIVPLRDQYDIPVKLRTWIQRHWFELTQLYLRTCDIMASTGRPLHVNMVEFATHLASLS